MAQAGQGSLPRFPLSLLQIASELTSTAFPRREESGEALPLTELQEGTDAWLEFSRTEC